jgi:hypothetical protein
MNERFEPDPLDELLDADPVNVDHLSSASLARIRARNEDVMTTTTPRRSWAPRTIGLGAGIAAVAAIALVVALGGRAGIAPGIAPGGSIGTGSAACVEPYSPTALANRSFAFDGTVSAIDGEQVTFTVGAAYRGVNGETITLDAPGMTGSAITSAGGPNLSIEERYLVAGDDHFVWSCGYTQAYDATVAADWAAAFGG